ncbi:MAG: NADH-quinone oxidoreductase subunit A [Cyclobacteriaceae bacterium]
MNNREIFLSAFGEVLLFIIGGILFILVAFFVSRLLRPNRPNAQKLSTYESGEEAISSAWTQFNIRFYIIALIFLLFEVEILFLFPWATIFADKELIEQTNGLWGWFSVTEVVIFIALLALGLAYAWVNDLLDWIKPEPDPTQMRSPVPKDLYQKINDRYAAVKRVEGPAANN